MKSIIFSAVSAFRAHLSNTASCLSLEHLICHNPSHWFVEKIQKMCLQQPYTLFVCSNISI